MCAKDLTPPEAAMLAGIISLSLRVLARASIRRRPRTGATWSCRRWWTRATSTRRSTTQGVKTRSRPPPRSRKPSVDSDAPYFTSWLRQQVVDLYGPGRAFGGGLTVHTSLDMEMQDTAQEIAQNTLAGVAPTASVVVLDNETGGVKAMVGGNDYENHPFNLATNGHRQPGSAFKPFTLATALSQGISPAPATRRTRRSSRSPHSKNEYFDVHNYGDSTTAARASRRRRIHSDNSVYAELALGRTLRCTSGMRWQPRRPRRHQADRPYRP